MEKPELLMTMNGNENKLFIYSTALLVQIILTPTVKL